MGCLKLTYRENLTPLKVVHGVFETSGKAGAGVYRYGFNGMEKDNEIKGEGNSYDFGARIYDPRLGRWLSTDPSESRYPGISTYNFGMNNPILFIDPDGEDGKVSVHKNSNGMGGTITISTTVHLYGKDVNKLSSNNEAETKWAKLGQGTYKDASGAVWTVKFDVSYIKHETEEAARAAMKANPGDNVMEVDFTEKREGMGVLGGQAEIGGNQGVIRNNNYADLMHETGHLLGYDERYVMVNLNNFRVPMKLPDTEYYQEFNLDIMNNQKFVTKFHQLHFDFMAKYSIEKTESTNVDTFILENGINLDKKYELNYEQKWVNPIISNE